MGQYSGDKLNKINSGLIEGAAIGNLIQITPVSSTPLIRLGKLSEDTGCTIAVKAEFLNPGGSVKDRAALYLIKDAEEKGEAMPIYNNTVNSGLLPNFDTRVYIRTVTTCAISTMYCVHSCTCIHVTHRPSSQGWAPCVLLLLLVCLFHGMGVSWVSFSSFLSLC